MCNIIIPFTGSADYYYNKAKQGVQQVGGTFNGNSSDGTFMVKTVLGTIAGSYKIAEQQLTMSITRKPFLLSCNRIEKELRKVVV